MQEPSFLVFVSVHGSLLPVFSLTLVQLLK